jgi:RNA polymerase sigma factor (sigma-70 family)
VIVDATTRGAPGADQTGGVSIAQRRGGSSAGADNATVLYEQSPAGATPGELFKAAADGDPSAWVTLTDRYTNLLWSVARGAGLETADAEDVVATAWMRLVEHLDTLAEPEHVGTWLVTTVRREAYLVSRRRWRTQPVAPDDLPDSEDPHAPEDALITAERDAALWRAFRSMSDQCQQLLRLLMADPAPAYAEVATALRMPVGSIGPTRARCLARLRSRLEPTAGG